MQIRLASVGLRRGLRRTDRARARARLHPHGLLLPAARRHHRARPRSGRQPRRARPRGDDRDRAAAPRPARRRPRRARARVRRRRARAHGRGAAALRQRLADAAHGAPARHAQLRRFFAARQFDVVHIHAPYNPSFFMLAPFVLPAGTIGVGTYHSVFTPGRVRDLVHAPTRASLQPAARAHRRLGRVHRAARPLLPRVRLARDPERHRRGPLPPERASPIEALRESGDPVVLFLGRFDPRNGLGIMLEAFDQLWRARDGHVRLCVVGDGPLRRYYAAKARARGRRGGALGGARRLEPPALLRIGRRVLHALPARQLRHGATRGHELRPSRRRAA